MAQKKTKKVSKANKTPSKANDRTSDKGKKGKVAAKTSTKVAVKSASKGKEPVKPVKKAASPPPVATKQTKKQALAASAAQGLPVVEAQADAADGKDIKKAKKALGKAKQTLVKARAKDFGSKLGKNLINQGMDELAKKWESLFKKAEGIESKPYRMKDTFEERTAIEHKILGWGFVLSNQNDRLEVLFRDGIRYLISNYKP